MWCACGPRDVFFLVLLLLLFHFVVDSVWFVVFFFSFLGYTFNRFIFFSCVRIQCVVCSKDEWNEIFVWITLIMCRNIFPECRCLLSHGLVLVYICKLWMTIFGWMGDCARVYVVWVYILGGSLFSSFVNYGRNTWHSTVLWMPLMGKGMVNYEIINETKNSNRKSAVSLNSRASNVKWKCYHNEQRNKTATKTD